MKEILERMHAVYEERAAAGMEVSISAMEDEFGVPRGKYRNHRANRRRTKGAMDAMAGMEAVVRRQPLDRVRWWENAREEFDPAELEGLADSLRDTGDPLQFPVGWMETDADGAEWFVGFIGERRYRASLLRRDRGDGVDSMLVRVVERPSERDALKWGLVENTQRASLKPMEEARAMRRMMDMADGETGEALWSLRSLAEEMGKPVAHVVWSLAALDAPAKAQAMLDEGRAALETVGRIGRCPAGIREAAAERILFGLAGPLSVRDARQVLANEFRRDLRWAEFDREEEGLDGLPACAACPWHGPNRDDVEGEAAKHLCLDPSCYARKQRAMAERTQAALLESGGDVRLLPESEAAAIFDGGGALSPTCGYVELDARPDAYWLSEGARHAASRLRWRDALEGNCPTVHLAWDADGRKRELVEAALALPAALHGRHASVFRAEAGSDLLSAEERRSLAERRNAAARAARAVCLDGGRELFCGLSGSAADWSRLMSLVELATRLLLKGDDFVFLCELLDSRLPKAQATERGFHGYLRSSGMDADGLVAVLALVLSVRQLRYEGFDAWCEEGPMADLCAAAGVDPAAWRRRWRKARRAGGEK